MAADFREECTDCGACAAVCPFLAQYGAPDAILSERPEISFYCTSCRRCDAVCPLGLSPSQAFFAAKQRLVKERQVPKPVLAHLEGARRFAGTGHSFPFSFYEKADTVFWPGCGLSANRPGLVRKIRKILGRRLRRRVGLVLDCCYDPVNGFGDTETAAAALRDINRRLHDQGVRRVITGCLNCHKLLLPYLEGMEVSFILDVLSPMPGAGQRGPVYLHHPCPSSRWSGIRESARGMVEQIHSSADDIHEDPAACCGAGGGLYSLSPQLAERFLARIVEKGSGRTIVTYCSGCQNRFLQRGVEAVHLLECLAGKAPRRKVPSPPAQWANRLILALTARLRTGKFMAGAFLALLIAGGVYLNQQHVFSVEMLTDVLAGYPVLAPLIFLAVYAVAPSLFLPSIPLTLAAGFFWGPVWGVVFSITGATIGACLSFFLARYIFQNAVKARVPAKRWQWLQDKVDQHGWKAVAFTRLIPVFPFNLLNYLFGLTPIPFRQYLWSTFVFMLPACIAFTAFGSSLGELIMRGNFRGVAIGIVVAVAAFLLPVALRPFFRKIGGEGPK